MRLFCTNSEYVIWDAAPLIISVPISSAAPGESASVCASRARTFAGSDGEPVGLCRSYQRPAPSGAGHKAAFFLPDVLRSQA